MAKGTANTRIRENRKSGRDTIDIRALRKRSQEGDSKNLSIESSQRAKRRKKASKRSVGQSVGSSITEGGVDAYGTRVDRNAEASTRKSTRRKRSNDRRRQPVQSSIRSDVRMAKRSRGFYHMGGFKPVMAGLLLLAIGFAVEKLNEVLGGEFLTYSTGAGFSIIGWAFVFFGCLAVFKYRKEYRKGFLICCIGFGFEVFSDISVLALEEKGLFETAQLSPIVAASSYISDIAVIGIYMFFIRGSAQLLAKYNRLEASKRGIWLFRIATVILLICIIVIPLGMNFDGEKSYLISGSAIFVSFMVQVIMCLYLNNCLKFLDGRRR